MTHVFSRSPLEVELSRKYRVLIWVLSWESDSSHSGLRWVISMSSTQARLPSTPKQCLLYFCQAPTLILIISATLLASFYSYRLTFFPLQPQPIRYSIHLMSLGTSTFSNQIQSKMNMQWTVCLLFFSFHLHRDKKMDFNRGQGRRNGIREPDHKKMNSKTERNHYKESPVNKRWRATLP